MSQPGADAAVQPIPVSPSVAAGLRESGSFLTSHELYLTVVILAFGLVAVFVFYMIVKTDKASHFLMRIYVVIILVFGTLIVVSSSYATEQIAPIVGFFGTIAGYLLGRNERQGDV